ncbi:hypothetical protein MHA01_26490 [Marinococcus halophilus]|uniref:KOW domain-containing protein n=1 Tax=Marinococcus halophilus TaxID=1371 RepID=A0A510Y8P0_MARHA|nr:KOW domain-containing RNA-binding protein [Marinococcus halophilus]GEK59744.1 hypothetical protein MHA01_26490 [Marinococcus halophilus]
MKDSESRRPDLGQIVRVTRGREAGQYAVVIGVLDDKFLMLADGERRKFDRGKKKNTSHVELLSYISPEVQSSLTETGRVTNAKIRHALYTFFEQEALFEKEN